ncbi:DUF4956 domain-containing protein [Lacihabitans sp. LS3-19]|uniref:DUF4956 domain-containing protein n=1 Tax=Lacihabitans sp. LS3-19 TaxID=2487335 RepID=UPI0020CECD31|nr:DUF4956 domain-containing protein [Lacihabitans sp. LS3-19]MCP9767184.1 DUF4956 domain-containing protein [Lacihabitans sp. LS3-19]
MILLQELASKTETFQWFDKVSIKFLSRFLVDIVAVFILVRFIYFRHYRRTDLFLTFFGFNIIIFLITYLLNKVEMSMGAAFGLFAVFSMLRYRTENISAKDMTYLFFAIALGLITAISKGSWDDLAIMCIILLGLTALLEGGILMKKENTKMITYEKIHLIIPERREELIQDLRDRTGLNIHRVDIQDIDFLKDATQITIFYYEN